MALENECKFGTIARDFHAEDHIDPPASHLCVWGLNGLMAYFIVRAVSSHRRSLRLARQADAAVDADAPLVANAQFVCGKVEFAEGQTNAISVEVDQTGTETRTNRGVTHRWTEEGRRTLAEPFYVRRADGERVRIEPGEKPLLIDEPDEVKWGARGERTRIARLTPGEDVIVRGILEPGEDPEHRQGGNYRTAPKGWIMKPRRDKPMEVCTEERGDRHRIRAEKYHRAKRYLWLLLMFVNLFFLFYHLRLGLGDDTCARVLKKDIAVTTSSKGRVSKHYNVYLELSESYDQSSTRELDPAAWEQVQEGTVLAFRYVPGHPPLSELGTGASVYYWPVAVGAFLVLLGYAFYSDARDTRRWYRGKLEDSGEGMLPFA